MKLEKDALLNPHFMRIGQEGLINRYDDFEDYLLDCLQNAINNN